MGPFDFGIVSDDVGRPAHGFRFGKGHFIRTGQGILAVQGVEDARLVLHAVLEDVHGLVLVGKGYGLHIGQGAQAAADAVDVLLGHVVFEIDRDFDLAFQVLSEIIEVGHEGQENAQDEQGQGDGSNGRDGHEAVAPERLNGFGHVVAHGPNFHRHSPPSVHRGRLCRRRFR